jgi:phosphatidylglycerol---prolipoprotein diacylglyceryl transferase
MFTAFDFAAIDFPAFDPVALKFGNYVWIRWYGLSYVAGLLLGWWYIRKLVTSPALWGARKPMTLDQVDSMLLWVLGGVVIGGRLGSILLYDLTTYINDPIEVFRTLNGGMSFHGGLIGVVIALVAFARQQGLRFEMPGDLVATAVPVGLFFGRIANFINGELWGRVSEVPWAMVFPGRGAGLLPRHPSQLYEAGLEGLVLGLMLWRGALQREGLAGGVFLAGYGVFRAFCELFREGDPTWFFTSGVITSGMLYCVPMVLAGAWLIFRARRQPSASVA